MGNEVSMRVIGLCGKYRGRSLGSRTVLIITNLWKTAVERR
jgi:hypothetical protein